MISRERLGWAGFTLALCMGALAAHAQQTPLPAPPTQAAPAATPAPAPVPEPPAAAPAPAAPPVAAAPAPAPAAQATPGATLVGPLELAPLKSAVKLTRIKTATCVASTLRFRIKNTSASDVKVALLMPGISASDDLGEQLLGAANLLKVSGITALTAEPREGWVAWMGSNANGLTTLSPGQTVETQIIPASLTDYRYLICTDDPASESFRSYRPSTYSMTGTIGVADLDGNAQVRSFSFSDAPLQVVAR